uniref:C2H2-type domain-containing protein n=1 Tax=Anopheles epiroticus TaxID=199890 RepID=A0A182PAQ3_9DIPT
MKRPSKCRRLPSEDDLSASESQKQESARLETIATDAGKADAQSDRCVDNPSHLTVECTECGKMFVDTYNLRRHTSVHTKHRPYQCDKCSRSFTQKGSLARHMLIHLRRKDFECTHCAMKFRQKPNLHSHIKQVHPPVNGSDLENRFLCKKCPSAFRTVGRLNMHRARFHGEMVMFDQCVQRGSTAQDASEQEEDSDHHLSDSEKPSDEEGSDTAQDTEQESEIVYKIVPSRRIEHMKGKTATRQHECKVCKAAFAKQGHLDRHMVSHRGFKAYRCDVCDKAFSTKPWLDTHASLHSQTDLPFSCDKCEKSFSRQATLKRHQKMIHEARKYLYRCYFCKKVFRWLFNCRTHVKRFHQNQESSEKDTS